MAQGFSVAVKLIDLATGPIGKINAAIRELEKNAKKASGTGRPIETRDALNRQKEQLEKIKKTREGLKDLRDRADDVSESFRKMFGPLGLAGLGVLASGGGIALISVQFARLGSEIGRTSTTLGINTVDLQKWQGAADLAGVGAEAITSSIAGLARGIYLMRNGLDPDMFRVMRRWGLDANKGATDAEKAANLILQVADKFKNDPALKGNKQAQAYLLEQLHIDPRTLYLMDQGRQKIEDLMEQARRNSLLTDQQIAQSFELQHALSGVQQAVGGLGNQIGADLSPKMTFVLQKTTEWIGRLKESPGAMKDVEVAGEILFAAMTARWGVALLRLIGNVTGLTKALTFLFKIPGMSLLGPLGAFAGTLYGGSLNEGEPNLMRYRHGGGIKVNGRIGLQSFQMGATPGLPELPPGMSPAENEANFNYGNLRAKGGQLGWQRFRNPQEGILAEANLLNRYQAEGVDTLRKIITKLGPPGENDTEGLIKRASGFLRIDPEQRLDLNNDPQLMARVVEAMFRNERGGKMPGGLTSGSISSALGGFGAGSTSGAVDAMTRFSGLGGNSAAVKGFLKAGGAGLDPSSAAWCAAFVNSSLALQGIPGSGSNVATSFETWGRGVGSAQKGDVLVQPRGLGQGQTGGHVGMATGRTRLNPMTGEAEVEMISGNRGAGHDVGTDWVPGGSVMIRRGYAPAVPGIAEGGGLGRGGAIGPQSMDLSHRVEVHFVNAPLGMRSGLTKASGPAEVSVRTHYSMDDLS